MICPRCLLRTSARQLRTSQTPTTTTITTTTTRFLSTNPRSFAAAASAPNPSTITPRSSSAATTTASGSQPFSAPTTASVKPSEVIAALKPTPHVVRSSVAAGTVLKGLNYFKNKTDPVAMEDHEYPEWLWSVLAEKKKGPAEGQKEEMDPRLFSKSAKARRMANKRARKEAQLDSGAAVAKIPLYEQSVDLPAGGEEALVGRMDLTKAMRGKRRRDIKEANFLKGMS